MLISRRFEKCMDIAFGAILLDFFPFRKLPIWAKRLLVLLSPILSVVYVFVWAAPISALVLIVAPLAIIADLWEMASKPPNAP